jgi:hypothetical protein
MAIRVIDQKPDVVVSSEELRKYRSQYAEAYRMYCGTPPSLEEFIRSQQASKEAVQNFGLGLRSKL